MVVVDDSRAVAREDEQETAGPAVPAHDRREQKMLNLLMDTFFGCSHRNTGFPITPRSKLPRRRFDTYVVCLDCGKEMPYSWEEMRVVSESSKSAPRVAEQVGSLSITK
jgi:hypothetical protein